MTARQRDPKATRAAILDAAETAFLAKGFAETSTAEVARLAGVTKSLTHHHFGSKDRLWDEVKVRRFSVYAAEQMAMLRDQEPSAELLRAPMRLYFRLLRSNSELVRLLAWMFLEQDGDEECADLDRELTLPGRREQDPGPG